MTPEEIIKQLKRYNIYDVQGANDKAIEAIKQYAREMCDKQKEICDDNLEVETIDSHGQDCCFVNSESIINAPYPKELQ